MNEMTDDIGFSCDTSLADGHEKNPEESTSFNPESASPDATRLAQLRRLFPEVFDENGILDTQQLADIAKGEGATHGNPDAERYRMTWAGKRQAEMMARRPSLATLRPNGGFGTG